MLQYVAEIGEIVRVQRRDEEEIDQLTEKINRVVRELLGQSTWMKVLPYFKAISSSLYYSATLLSGVQTIGEEYVSLFQVGSSASPPIIPAQLVFVALHVWLPVLTEKCLVKAEITLRHPSTRSFLGIPLEKNQKARQSSIQLVQTMRSKVIPWIRRLHLALFYIHGAYYSISRRLTGIRFKSLSPHSDSQALKAYRFMGYVTILQCAVSVALGTIAMMKDAEKRTKENTQTQSEGRHEKLASSSFTCPICIEKSPPSALPCGHVFCWYCAQERARVSSPATCPLCRVEYHPRTVVPLLNH